MGAVAGIAVCFVVATIYVLSSKTVRKESDMKKVTVKSCITVIPDVKLKKRINSQKEQLLITNRRVDWGFRQSILGAQSRIERQMEKENKRVLLVSSTLPEEGKSLFALNLALAFEQERKMFW